MSGLKREDEYRLKELTQLAEEQGRENLDEDQLLHLQLLEDRYNKFLDEGLRKLREAANPHSPRQSFRSLFSGRSSPKMSPASPPTDESSETALDGRPSTAPVQAPGKHWTWILEQLIVGAVPYASQTTDTPGHLCELNEQCFHRKSRIGAVVSCLDVEESIPNGFAAAKDWEVQLSVNTFFHVSCIPSGVGKPGEDIVERRLTAEEIALDLSPLGPSKAGGTQLDNHSDGGDNVVEQVEQPSPLPSDPVFEEIIAVCQNVAKIMEPDDADKKGDGLKHRLSIASRPGRRRVVYVHCKAGLARSWVFAMCFLMYQHHRTFEEADTYLRSLRNFTPKPVHISLVQRFASYITSPKFAATSDDEDKYIRLLADVLSLAPKYRQKLLQDLEKLT